jgi:hypothetical protein
MSMGYDENNFAKLIEELNSIGKQEGYLSVKEHPKFDATYKNIRAREIGEILDSIGSKELMQKACIAISNTLGPVQARELEAAWRGIGSWY